MNQHFKMNRIGLLACLTFATSNPVAVNAKDASFALEEIVVTAQKRAESLQDTPIAITAFTSAALADKGVSDISEIAKFTPSLVFDTTSPIGGVSSGAAVFIRGIGNTDFSLTTDPGVGTYVDGVYVARSVGGVLDVLDVERIEVLRGPQGTLFGRNTIGGAINIVSRAPADEFKAAIEGTVGNDGRADLRASVDIPFSETFRSAWSISSKNRDGFVDRPLAGDELGDEQRVSFRGSFDFTPNDNWDFQASFDYTDIDESAAPSVGVGFTAGPGPQPDNPPAPPNGAGVLGAAFLLDNAIPLPTGTTVNPFIPGIPEFFNVIGNGIATFNQFVVDDIDADVSFGTGPQFSQVEVFGASFVANYHGSNFDLKYTGSFRTTESQFASDADNSPFQITEIINDNYEVDQQTHELQITGTAADGRFKYAAGLFYFEEEGTDDVNVPVSIPSPDFGPGSGAVFEASIRNDAEIDNSSEAAYFQATYDINDVLAVTGGIRFTEDDKGYAFTQFIGANLANDPLPFLIGGPAAQTEPGGPLVSGLIPLLEDGTGSTSETFDETQFKLGIDAQVNDNTLLYYSFSQGFKSGGFVLRFVAAQPEPLSFDPETLDTHEIGIKWQSPDNRFRINAAAYTSDYEDVQVTLFDALGGPITDNAGTADINGFELELTAVLTDNLKLDLGYGYIDAEYTEISPSNDVVLSSIIPLDADLVNTPENTFSLGLEYIIPLAGSRDLTLRGDYSFTDDVFNDSQNSAFLFQESTDLVSASAKLSLNDNSEVVVWVENLTDERFIISGNSNFGLGFHSAVPSRPREFGVTYRHRF